MNHLELYDCILDKLNDTATEAELIGLRDVCQRGLVRTQMRLDDLEAAKPKKPGPKPGSVRKTNSGIAVTQGSGYEANLDANIYPEGSASRQALENLADGPPFPA